MIRRPRPGDLARSGVGAPFASARGSTIRAAATDRGGGLDDVQLATLEYVDWFNHRRLHSHCGDIAPVEFERSDRRPH